MAADWQAVREWLAGDGSAWAEWAKMGNIDEGNARDVLTMHGIKTTRATRARLRREVDAAQTRNVTGAANAPETARSSDSTPSDDETQEPRYAAYRLCPCDPCDASGKVDGEKCKTCRGEGRVREEVCSAPDEQGLGQCILTNAREGAWEGCQFGLLDREGEKGQRWLILPWPGTARTVSEAGRLLQSAQRKGER